ncbi:hypothetical protein [Burkholderia cepacia]|uniref:hypothetical protein n=1 Tax=Burkholderia cepacia TaxID=292 RepID=UPI001FC7FF02|nr:hypothetical protein [Burkholderia cepacia]
MPAPTVINVGMAGNGRPSEDPSTFRNTTHVPYRAINSCDIMIYPPAPNRSDALAAGNPLASFG